MEHKLAFHFQFILYFRRSSIKTIFHKRLTPEASVENSPLKVERSDSSSLNENKKAAALIFGL